MARKKAEHGGEATAPAEPAGGAQATTGTAQAEKKRPVMSFKLFSDQRTSIEAAVWGNPVKYDNQETIQYSVTITRSYKADDGWHQGGSFRVHDLPILDYLVRKCHDWCLEQRTTVLVNGAPVPF
jgi:hypothetical protein